MVTVTLQVVSRLMGHSLPWTEETTRYLFIWTAFLGLAAGFRSAEHARIGIVITLLPPVLRRLLAHAYVLAGLVFFGVVGYKGFQLSMQQFRSGETSPALGIGMYLVTLPVTISAILAILAHFQSVYRDPALREQIEKGGLPE
jgi:TRAP-type C4-dicarboxylate transport system permease small subunit